MRAPSSYRRLSQAGGGRIGLVIALVLVGLAIHVAVQWFPPRIAKAELGDAVKEAATSYSLDQINYDQLIQTIAEEAKHRDIGLSEKDISVDTAKKEVTVTVEYEVVLDMIWGEWPQEYTITKTVPKF